MSKDNINPDHYKNETSLECIEAMQIAFGREWVLHFCMLNAWKYIWRWKHKNGREDLIKAQWYVNRSFQIVGDPETSPQLHSQRARLAEMNLYLAEKLKETENGNS